MYLAIFGTAEIEVLEVNDESSGRNTSE